MNQAHLPVTLKKVVRRRESGFSRLERGIRNTLEGFGGLIGALSSADAPTRRGATFFFVSLFGAIAILSLTIHTFVYKGRLAQQMLEQSNAAANSLADFLGRQSDLAKRRNIQVELGRFTMELRRLPGQRFPSGVMNMAEMELVAECDTRRTCEYIHSNDTQMRNQLINGLTPMDRDDLFTRDGKARLKRKLMDRLNLWLPYGRVEEIYFTNLQIS